MRATRLLAVFAIGGLLGAGVLVDIPQRAVPDRAGPYESALAAPAGAVNTWFCPGGSSPDGVAEPTVQLANASDEPRTVVVSVLPGGSGTQEPSTFEVGIEPLGRVLLQPSESAPGAEWVGAMVETTDGDVVVEQILTAARGGVGRSPCLTRTAESWIVSNGATRSAVERERFVVMLLNPFPDDAVVDIDLVADVGRDSIDGLVVPARRVAAVDVTTEVTVASTVAAFIDVVSGRVAASWIQVSDGPVAGRGTRTAPAVPGAAELWHLPVAAVGDDRRDVVAVSNPSSTDVAEVDVEVVPENPNFEAAPIEVTVRPGRTALIDLSQQGRLDGAGRFSLIVRSLTPVPVAASITSVVSTSDGAGGVVAGATATIGADGAARRWLVPAEAPDQDAAAETAAGMGVGTGALVIVNPSAGGIAQADISVYGSPVRSVEVGPMRSRRLPLSGLGSGRFVVEVESSAPVVVGREVVGLTSRSASLGVAVDRPVPIAGTE